jgi:hypothetical protein
MRESHLVEGAVEVAVGLHEEIIESAGKDGKFGWWGSRAAGDVNAQAVEDNLYKP